MEVGPKPANYVVTYEEESERRVNLLHSFPVNGMYKAITAYSGRVSGDPGMWFTAKNAGFARLSYTSFTASGRSLFTSYTGRIGSRTTNTASLGRYSGFPDTLYRTTPKTDEFVKRVLT